jgi:hypothetical protein
MSEITDIITDILDEEHPHIHADEEPQQGEPPRGPRVEYEATYVNRKGKMELIEDILGFQFDGGFYFLFVLVEGMPVPQVRVLDLSSPDIRDLRVTPIRLIEQNG